MHIRNLGFGYFMDAVCALASPQSRCVLRGLCERFWGTTNTFHFPFGQMTITPDDFSMLTGLPFVGDALDYQGELFMAREDLCAHVGNIILKTRQENSFSIDILFEHLEEHLLNGCNADEGHLIRIFLAAMLSATIFADRSSRCHFHYLGNLFNLGRIPYLNWASAGLSNLLHHLRSGPRKIEQTWGLDNNSLPVSGFWKILEPWFFTYFPLLAPPTTQPLLFPAVLSWSRENSGKRQFSYKDINAFRSRLDQLMMPGGDVWRHHYNLSGAFGPETQYTQSRVLLRGPSALVWYLGERVSLQYLPLRPPAVPHDPPISMFYTISLSMDEISDFSHLVTASTLCPTLQTGPNIWAAL